MTGLGNPKLRLIESVADAQEFLDWIGQRRPLNAIAIDLETGELPGGHKDDAFSPWHGVIRLAQVGDAEMGWAMDWSEWSGVFYEALSRHDGLIVAHNIAFEAKWLAVKSRFKMPWERAHDTMIMSQVVNPNSVHGLKPLTSILVDPLAATAQSMLDRAMIENKWTWGTVPISYGPYWMYGALDTVITMKIFLDHFWPKVKPGAQFARAYEIEIAMRQIATNMEIRGVKIDLEYCKKKYEELQGYADGVKDWAAREYKGLSIGSDQQLARQFLAYGMEFTEFTKSNKVSVNADQMTKFVIEDRDPYSSTLARQVLSYRKATKLAGSYFLNFQDRAIGDILHPTIKTLEARTGRMSIVDPALQTLPSGDSTVRRAFLPFKEGHGIISSDLDQVEFRLSAHFSKDQSLIDLFLEADRVGGDTFTYIMWDIYNDRTLTKEDKRRKLVKATVYGKLFGAGIEKMALQSQVTYDTMAGVVHAFDDTYPGIKRMQKGIERAGAELLQREGEAYVTLASGRRLPADDDRLYALTNYTIQGTAAEVFKMNLIEIDKAGLGEFMMVPVHDEIVMSAPKEDAEEIMVTVQECMTTTGDWRVPLTAGVEGPFDNWGQKYED